MYTHKEPQLIVETSKLLYNLFEVNSTVMESNGSVVVNGLVRMSTSQCATLISTAVLTAARTVMKRRAAEFH